jgi:hypothetical protein
MRRQLGDCHPFQACEQINVAKKARVIEVVTRRNFARAFGSGVTLADLRL